MQNDTEAVSFSCTVRIGVCVCCSLKPTLEGDLVLWLHHSQDITRGVLSHSSIWTLQIGNNSHVLRSVTLFPCSGVTGILWVMDWSVFLQRDAEHCCVQICRWDIVIRMDNSEAAWGSTTANRLLPWLLHRCSEILQRTLPVAKLGGHKSSDALLNGSQDTQRASRILGFLLRCREQQKACDSSTHSSFLFACHIYPRQ